MKVIDFVSARSFEEELKNYFLANQSALEVMSDEYIGETRPVFDEDVAKDCKDMMNDIVAEIAPKFVATMVEACERVGREKSRFHDFERIDADNRRWCWGREATIPFCEGNDLRQVKAPKADICIAHLLNGEINVHITVCCSYSLRKGWTQLYLCLNKLPESFSIESASVVLD